MKIIKVKGRKVVLHLGNNKGMIFTSFKSYMDKIIGERILHNRKYPVNTMHPKATDKSKVHWAPKPCSPYYKG